MLSPRAARANFGSRSPQQIAVEKFYVALEAQDYEQAYSFFSSRYRSTHPFGSWVNGYASTIDFTWRTYPTGAANTIGVDLISTDSTARGNITQYFSGVWHVVRGGAPGGWVLDSAEIGAGGPWAAPGAPDFSAFASGWYRHGFGILVNADGTTIVSFRTYTWCSDDPTIPCDFFSGNNIISGGHETITFTSISGNTAYGSYDDGGDVSLTLGSYDTAILTDAASGDETVLCGPNFGTLAPPSVIADSPCGA